MTDTQHRTYRPDADDVAVRDVTDESATDGLFRIRMPVTSTAEARDGEAFDRERVEGFRDQLEAERVPVFLDHGRNQLSGHRYSALGKVGYLDDPDVRDRDEATDLLADFVLLDPGELDGDAGPMRAALSMVRQQAERDIPLASSIGWSEDTGERDLPGDADLLEASIVGIPSDSRTTTDQASAEPALARAVDAASSDFDVERFVRELESQTRNVVEVGDEEIDLSPPEAVQNAATLALAKDDELDPDCGTGAGRESARQIAGDDVTAERIDDIAAYLTSHEEDVTAEGPPSDWSNEEWEDCGNIQYALWGGTGTGTGLEWAQAKANEVASAMDDELPYPDRALAETMAREAQPRNLDDPEFSEGDPVEWSSNDATVRGRVADVGAEFSPAEGVTITGDEGEAVYLIHELDDSLDPPQYRRENVAKPESSLDESQADLPPLEGNFADDDTSMSESDTAGDDPGDDEREEDGMDANEFRQSMLEMQEEQTEILREMREGDHGDDEDDDDDMEEDSADADDTDRSDSAEESDTRTVTVDGEERDLDSAAEHIRSLRAEVDETEPAEPDTQDRADEDDTETTERSAPDWRA